MPEIGVSSEAYNGLWSVEVDGVGVGMPLGHRAEAELVAGWLRGWVGWVHSQEGFDPTCTAESRWERFLGRMPGDPAASGG